MIIVERIKELLNEQHLSNKAFFKSLGMTVNTLSNWEKGRTPNQVSLMQIADALGVSVMYLKGETDDRHPELTSEHNRRKVYDWFEEYGVDIESYDNDNGVGEEYVLSFDGVSRNYQEWEFDSLCVTLFKHSQDAHDLVMQDFVSQTFKKEKTIELDDDELDLIMAFRTLKGIQKHKIVHYCLSAMEENARQEGQA